MSRILSVANQKGGVGKTTTAINLATALAIAEQRILVVDMDPQGNLTSGLGLKGRPRRPDRLSGADAAGPVDAGDFILETRVKGLWLIPPTATSRGRKSSSCRCRIASAACANLSIRCAIASTSSSSTRRRRSDSSRSTPSSPRRRPHSAQLRILRARRARRSRRDAAPRARRAQSDARHRRRPHDDVRRADEPGAAGRARHPRVLQDRVFDTVIPRNIRLGEAPSHGLPAILYDVKSRGSEAYLALAREVLARETAASQTEQNHG
jgi:chromosome partitioning protein